MRVRDRRSKPNLTKSQSRPPLPSPNPKQNQRFVRRCGTPLYMAPEIFRKDYHVVADM